MAQRFYRQNIAQYNPLSFEEMMFAPSMMRQQHDALDASLMETQTSLGQFNALSQDMDFAQKAIDPVSQELNQMAEQLSREGFTNQSMSGFRKLKTQRDKLFSPTGEVGIAQARLASFQEKAKELKEQYKNNPEIANYYINQLAQSPGLQRDVDGNIINQGLNSINNVRHYDAKEINDILNSQIDNIKDTLIKDYGFSQVGNASSVQEIWRELSMTGRTADEINKILLSQVSPEILRSAQQYGMATMGSAEAGVQSLMNQIAGAATGRSNINMDSRYQVVTNEDKKFIRDQSKTFGDLTYNPGPLTTRTMQETVESAGLVFNESGELEDKPLNALQKANQWVSDLQTEAKNNGTGWNPFILAAEVFDTLVGTAGKVITNPRILLGASNPAILRVELQKADLTQEFEKEYNKRKKEAVKNDFETSVKNYKEAFPESKNMSNKDIYELIVNQRNNYSQVYSDVIAPKNEDGKALTQQIVGDATHIGDFGRRAVYLNNHSIGTGEDLYKQLGYETYDEFKKEGQLSVSPGVTLGAYTPGAHVGNAIDKKTGQPVSFTIQANKEVEAVAKPINSMLKYITKGEFFKELDQKTAFVDFNIVPEEGNKIYYLHDINTGAPVLIEAPENYNPSQVREFVKSNPGEVITMEHMSTSALQNIYYR